MGETGFYWHVHHDVLMEWCYDAERRRAYIRAHKPESEHEARLRLMRPVRGELPAALARAWKEYYRAWQEHRRARAGCDRDWREHDWRVGTWKEYSRARAEYDRARQECAREIEALHAEECPDCPWDGKTIFPEKEA